MRSKIRTYLLENTPKTESDIPDGTRGELSKIIEEYHELMDADSQELSRLTLIESLDLMDAVIAFQFRRFKLIFLVSYVLILARRIYKPIRNLVYDYAGLGKDDFNRGTDCPECMGGGFIAKLYPNGHTEERCEECEGTGEK